MSAAAVRAVNVERHREGERRQDRDYAAVDEPMEVRVNGSPFAVIMRPPGHDIALAAGFLLAEDVIRGADELASVELCQDVEPEAALCDLDGRVWFAAEDVGRTTPSTRSSAVRCSTTVSHSTARSSS